MFADEVKLPEIVCTEAVTESVYNLYWFVIDDRSSAEAPSLATVAWQRHSKAALQLLADVRQFSQHVALHYLPFRVQAR